MTRHGNSWAIVIDKPILDLLHLDPARTPVELHTDGKNLLIEGSDDRRKFYDEGTSSLS